MDAAARVGSDNADEAPDERPVGAISFPLPLKPFPLVDVSSTNLTVDLRRCTYLLHPYRCNSVAIRLRLSQLMTAPGAVALSSD